MVILASFCVVSCGLSTMVVFQWGFLFCGFWISLCVRIIFTFFFLVCFFFLVHSASFGLDFFCLTHSSQSSMLKLCFRDHVASIFFKSLRTYFSKLLSWSLNHLHFFPKFFAYIFLLLTLFSCFFCMLALIYLLIYYFFLQVWLTCIY